MNGPQGVRSQRSSRACNGPSRPCGVPELSFKYHQLVHSSTENSQRSRAPNGCPLHRRAATDESPLGVLSSDLRISHTWITYMEHLGADSRFHSRISRLPVLFCFFLFDNPRTACQTVSEFIPSPKMNQNLRLDGAPSGPQVSQSVCRCYSQTSRAAHIAVDGPLASIR